MSYLKIKFLRDPTVEQIKQITDLYRKAGWWDDENDNPERVAGIVDGSHGFCVGMINDTIVAMGRAISDGISDAYIQDVTVDENQRGQGIGTKIVEMLVHRLENDGLGWIGLIAERGTTRFYKPMGFKKMPDSAPMLRIGS